MNINITEITPEIKIFMNDLWGSEGNFMDTPIGRGRIESVRTKFGIDLEVIVKIPDMDGETLFSGLELCEWNLQNSDRNKPVWMP